MTPTGWVERAWKLSSQWNSICLSTRCRTEDRSGREKGSGVRMRRPFEERLNIRDLDNASEVHDRHAIREMTHHREVVSDDEIREREALFEVYEEVHDLRPHRRIESRCRLISHEKSWLSREGTRDSHTLSLAPGEIGRKPRRETLIETYSGEKFFDAGVSLLLRADLVNVESLANRVLDLETRVERCLNILKDHLHLPSSASQRGS